MIESEKILREVHDFARENFVMILSDECERELKRLFSEYKPKRVLEIGTAIGYSSSVMALASDCKIDTIEKDGERIRAAKELWKKLGVDGRINCYHGDADELLASVVEGKTYDFVFLDGAKSAYKRQLEFLERHIKRGGIVLCDDVLYLGLVKGDGYPPHKHRTIVNNMRAFLKYVEESDIYECDLIEEANGIAIVRKK
ncbi:MAG: O-methyltransferase [Clostridia bacterium]|nr:O-methyltransferase [Clostridia bacterium]